MYILFSMCKQRSIYCFDYYITMYYVYRRSFVLALVLLGNPNKYVYTNEFIVFFDPQNIDVDTLIVLLSVILTEL